MFNTRHPEDRFMYLFLYCNEFWNNTAVYYYCSFITTYSHICTGDSEAERIKLRLSERTYSLWSYINQPDVLEQWINPLYEPNPGVIWPSVAPISIQLWRELYLAHTSAAPWNDMLIYAKQIKQNHTTVRKVAGQLQAQIKQALEEIRLDPDMLQNADCQEEEIGPQDEENYPCIAQLNLESQSTWYRS